MTFIETYDDDINDEEHDPSWSSPQLCIGPEGLRIANRACSTCIFNPGNPMRLQPGRVRGMVDAVVATDSFTQCHKTLGCKPGEGMLCHGMTKRHAGQIVRMAERLGFITEVDPVE